MSAAVVELARRAKVASRRLGTASTDEKNAALHHAADLLLARAAEVLDANAADLAAAEADGHGALGPRPAPPRRCPASRPWPTACARSPSLPDPVGEMLDGTRRPNGLEIQRMRVPLGVVAIIYENRPNVTSDAAGHLPEVRQRGRAAGLEHRPADPTGWSPRSLREGVTKAGLPGDAVILVDDVTHEAAVEVMQLHRVRRLPRCPAVVRRCIQSIRDNADRAGDHRRRRQLPRLRRRRRRPRRGAADRRQREDATGTSVCNAAESLVVHEAVADAFLPRGRRGARRRAASSWSATPAPAARVPAMGAATDDDFGREFLDLKISRGRGARPRRRDRARQPVRHRPHRGDRHARPRGGPSVHRRGRRRGR